MQEIEPEIEHKQEQNVEQEEHVQEPEVEEKAKIKKEGEGETRPARLRPKIARRVDDKGKIEECDSSGDECTNKVSEHPSSDEEPIAAAESSDSDVGEIIDEFRGGDSD
ncbi:hypothetical protein TRFO_41295 [Tritrichomonas foetus]|uniref:Uncharacterized protein n=1 Tax=Tritrichomonas foetus TaxID=1144522 RepID=A0A1J4L575_9EUKA|nr:hypothetical protein TRFO_41295 [Tritrichomonas foetus]|eukprot:OHT17086.1 hypothetical protein TRFO_41295 [Tritrichomonas foetus]